MIAIDGPAGSGKSTIARLAAKRLRMLYIDSGAIYRAYTLQYLKDGFEREDQKKMPAFLKQTKIDLKNQDSGTQILVNGEDVTEQIRSLEVTKSVSAFSKQKAVREMVTQKLRSIAQQDSVIMEGRDIGTVVFPDADLKIFATASIEERARRRTQDFKLAGIEADVDKVVNDLQRRDKQDSERALAPLKKAENAILLDTTNQSIEESVDFVVQKAQEFLN